MQLMGYDSFGQAYHPPPALQLGAAPISLTFTGFPVVLGDFPSHRGALQGHSIDGWLSRRPNRWACRRKRLQRIAQPSIRAHLDPDPCHICWACRKLCGRSHEGREPALFSGFICLREPKTEREKPVLLTHRPCAGKAEPLPQPQHGLKPPDRASCRVEGLKAADPRHRPLDPEDPMGVWQATRAPGE